MKLIEMKNRLALETAILLFKNGIDAIFIGGTALNTFHLDYRYSEDLDLAYARKNNKAEIERILSDHGYRVDRTDLKYRDIIVLEGVSIKLDVVEFNQKYNGTEERMLSGTVIRTLKIEEFFVEKIISFFTREEWIGLGRDACDIFSMEERYHLLHKLLPMARNEILKNIASTDLNIRTWMERQDQIEEMMAPYLRKPVAADGVRSFLQKLQRRLHE